MKKAITAGLALACVLSVPQAQASVSAGHWEVQGSNTALNFGLYQDEANTDVTYLYATVDTTTTAIPTVAWRTLTGNQYTLDSAADLYIVHEGAQLSNALFEAGTYTALVGATNASPSGTQGWPSTLIFDNDEFWVGARIRSGNLGDQPWTGLGWAHLRFEDDGSITLLGSAMAYDESSLVVGAVPEPSSWALMGAGLVALGLRTRMRRRTDGQRG
ncbi:MAG TPA: PEP-CTERM sorting domain-containing protein [Candidatus Aquabacterium excrementipullorum]|nr:PEP-CTERM sorting domain-containing protein [Candidatus Aquabacterium excrementipullorum]